MVDPQQNKVITKTKFYRFLSENKILQNADEAKTEEMLKQVMISWGAQAAGNSGRDDHNQSTQGEAPQETTEAQRKGEP